MQYANSGFSGRRRIVLGCGIIAIALHALVLFCWDSHPRAVEIQDVAEGAVEVELFEGLSAVESAATDEPAEPIEEIPQPEPEPSPQETPSEMPILPAPEPSPEPMATPQPSPKPAPRKVAQASTPAKKGVANSPASGALTKGAPEGTGRQLIGKPTYIVKPSPSYPAESRNSREQGLVVLRITVNATGRPMHVEILKSSGYPRLDRAALEAGWRCRIRNASAGDQFARPLRFNLQN
jgi:protein TonB